MWFGSFGGGLISFDLMSGEILRPFHGEGSSFSPYVYSLFIDYNHMLWVGTLESMQVIDLNTDKQLELEVFVDGVQREDLMNVRRIYQDHKGVLWFGTTAGLFKLELLEKDSQRATIYLKDLTPVIPSSFTDYERTVSTITGDQLGNLWFGGIAGLVRYSPATDKWNHFKFNKDNSQSLSNDNVQVIFEDSHGFLWVGTGDGLNRLVKRSDDPSSFYFNRITTKDGLPNGSIYGILEDKDKKLWLSTNLGLVNYVGNNKKLQPNSYRSQDGLSSDEFNTGAYFSDSDGKLFFGSINGVTKVSPTNVAPKTVTRPLVFTKLSIGEREVDTQKINHQTDPVVTQHNYETGIDISLSNLSFDKLATQRYRYRIKEIDENWKYLGVRRNLFIAALPEGVYNLEVQSKLVGQSWDEPGRNLTIMVEADFWKSAYAYYLVISLTILIFILGLMLVIRHYQNVLSIVNKKMGVESLRTKELRLDNDLLNINLLEREKELSDLHRKYKVIDSKLDVEKYRDVTTGFYRLNYFYKIDQSDIEYDNFPTRSDAFSKCTGIALLEISDHIDVHNDLGPLAASELLSKVSVSIRQRMNANSQIFCVKYGMFLVLSDYPDYQSFEDDVINLKHLIRRSQYDVANGLTRTTDASISLIDVSGAEIVRKKQAISLIDSMIQWHQQLQNSDSSISHRFEVATDYLKTIDETGSVDLVSLIQQQSVTTTNV
jgi:hypothetical protein